MITTSRIGKIARLPYSIREQLNLKLHDGIPAKSILPWLNSLPRSQSILAADFDSRPITKQNLSEWKQGGFRDWLLQYHASQFLQFLDPCSSRREPRPEGPVSGEAQTLSREGAATSDHPNDAPHQVTHHESRITDTEHATRNTDDLPHGIHGTHGIAYKLLLWTQLQYTTMARHIDSETDPDRKWAALRQFANDISRLRRSTLADDYLQIQRDWLAIGQSNSTEKKELEFCKWIKRPDIADALKNKKRGLTRELLRKIEEEDLYLVGPDNASLDEHIAQVRLAKELMARRKAKEAEGNRQPGAPAPEPPEIKLRETTFEELFPTIPDKPITELYPELDDDPNHAKPQSKKSAGSNADIPVGADSPSPTTAQDNPVERCPGGAATGIPKSFDDQTAANPVKSDFPLPEGEGQGEGEKTFQQPTAHDQNTNMNNPENAPDSPALRSAFGEGGSDSVQPSPTESNQIQPGSPLDPGPNPNNDSPTPDK